MNEEMVVDHKQVYSSESLFGRTGGINFIVEERRVWFKVKERYRQ